AGVHWEGAVGALVAAEAAADAPVFHDHLAAVAAVDRADRAADHADRVEAGAAAGRVEGLGEAGAVEEQPAAAVVVGVDAGPHALVAARATVEVDQHQPLAL